MLKPPVCRLLGSPMVVVGGVWWKAGCDWWGRDTICSSDRFGGER
ncbi:hypothetical protein I545_4316 [Mycobacterium kansasii 662]|uniref:Uncharacterized protein n=1 Tax=Mycobacterium kansasii 662 TaxID=1299326 RepID=X7ZCN9_MYCKA|nr:hypothetical protein I545_4316 [Mycobacterium kansasii 662]